MIVVACVAAVAFQCGVWSCSCSCSEGESAVTCEKATARGAADADSLVRSLPLSEMELQGMLLGVRSTEQIYRSHGYDEEADAYIKGFGDYLKVHCDTLAVSIGIK